MTRQQLALTLCGLSLTLLSACLRPADPSAFITVVSNEAGKISPEACDGGLKAVIYIANVELVNQTVAVGEMVIRSTSELPKGSSVMYQGSHVTAEAWCFNKAQEEVGYAETQGTLNLNPLGQSIGVRSYNPDPSLCAEGTRRGRFPCIDTTGVE